MTKKNKPIQISHMQLQDSIVEQVYDPMLTPSVQFAMYSTIDKETTFSEIIETESGEQYIPIQTMDLFTKGVVLLPSEAIDYGTEGMLVEDIKGFIHKYLDIHPFYETVAAHYVLMSWVFDRLPVCPYIRAIGDYGSGKTRFVQTIGALCYKPMFLSGATSDAYLFRVIEMFGGSLVINEMERVNTDMKSQITIILNCGYEKGMPVGRVEGDKKREPRTFDVYCPKILSTRKRFKDQALESRIITVPMQQTKRTDIPPTITESFWHEAGRIRNKLLMYRFEHLSDMTTVELLSKEHQEQIAKLEPRLRQTLLPLILVMSEKKVIDEFLNFAFDFEKQLVTDRGLELNGLIAEKLCELAEENNNIVTVKQIRDAAVKELENDNIKLTSHKIGKIIRDELGLKTRKGAGGLYHVVINQSSLDYIKSRYGIESPPSPSTPPQSSNLQDDLVDSVDLQKSTNTWKDYPHVSTGEVRL